jgi:hypothetical protein
VPSGRLALKFLSGGWLNAPRSSWRDGKRRKLEEQLHEFVAAVLDLGERHRLWRLEREREERRQAEAQRRAEAAERRRKLEAARVKDLDERLGAWNDAAAIEGLASELERAHGDTAPREWLHWARERASALRQQALAIPAQPAQDL